MPKAAKLSPKSWLQNSMLTPVEAASMNVLSNAVLVAASVNTSPVTLSQELVTTEAPLVTAVFTAASRPSFRQFLAPTYWMCAPGAIVCDDSTSSACSEYQPRSRAGASDPRSATRCGAGPECGEAAAGGPSSLPSTGPVPRLRYGPTIGLV